MRDGRTNNDKQVKIELLSQWKLEAEFRNFQQKMSKLSTTTNCQNVGQVMSPHHSDQMSQSR